MSVSSFLKSVLLLLALLLPSCGFAQKLIEYQAGIGSRDPENSDLWILYNRVRATHEGMVLYADSATLDTVLNNNVSVTSRIEESDRETFL